MYLVAAFKHCLNLDLTISDLLQSGLSKEKILAIPLKQESDYISFSDNLNRPLGNSIIDSAAVMGTAMMVLGVIYGFVWNWGPIIWGLIGLLTGVAAGALLAILRNKSRHSGKRSMAEVVLIINCCGNDAKEIEKILWTNQALGVGRFKSRTKEV